MQARALILFLLLATAAPSPHAATIAQAPAVATERSEVLAREGERLKEALLAVQSADPATARSKARASVEALFAVPESGRDASWTRMLADAGQVAWIAHDPETARAAWELVLDVRSRTLSEEHVDRQAVVRDLAAMHFTLGDLPRARVLQERSLEVLSRARAEDDSLVVAAKQNLAVTLRGLGETERARAMLREVFESVGRTLPAAHPVRTMAELNFAVSLVDAGELHEARALLAAVVRTCARTLPEGHSSLATARLNFASVLRALDELPAALLLQEGVLEGRERRLPADHPDRLSAQHELATTLHRLGRVDEACRLRESVLLARERLLPEAHADRLGAMQNLALSLKAAGEVARARVLEERVLAVRERTLPDDHAALMAARSNLGTTLYLLRDLAGARAHLEQALVGLTRAFPEDHPDVQTVRHDLAIVLEASGDLAGALALREAVVEVLSRTRPEEDAELRMARSNLAHALRLSGELHAARRLLEEILEAAEASSTPPPTPALLALSGTLRALGQYDRAEDLAEQALAAATSRPGEEDHVGGARRAVLLAIWCANARGEPRQSQEVAAPPKAGPSWWKANVLVTELARAQVTEARVALAAETRREAEERCAQLDRGLSLVLAAALGYSGFPRSKALDAAAFASSEATRGASGARRMHALRSTRSEPASDTAQLRATLRTASEKLARLVRNGTTSKEYDRACRVREEAERALARAERALADEELERTDVDVESVAAVLAPRSAAIAYRRFERLLSDDTAPDPDVAWRERRLGGEGVCAFVVRPATAGTPASLALVDLGPVEPIEAAVRAWRASLGVAAGRGTLVEGRSSTRAAGASSSEAQGVVLRSLVLDPLRPLLADVEHLIVVPDDVLHLVPFDAFPTEGRFLGDVLRIEVRATLGELLLPSRLTAGADAFVGVGGVHFADLEGGPAVDGRLAAMRFGPLPGSRAEIVGLAARFAEAFGARDAATVLTGAAATKEALLQLAPSARWLHLATHGWHASESFPAWFDPEPIDHHIGFPTLVSGDVQIRGSSPMQLSGLALAGANLPRDASGRESGLVTADEIATLELLDCELAVLSACDTNVGERRAGQGVASLQRALHLAGARSVVTSLWKVPDEATMELMLEFYRRLWIEKEPKWRSLWEAKRVLRDARDESGNPRYALRDWAAWVLTGPSD